jgi:DNA-binding transcriptional LysR family regulator
MDLNHLDVFVAVAEHKSFTAAAKALDLQRSAVSRRISALEVALGVELFLRSTRRVELSPDGRRLLRDVAPLLGQLHQAVHALPEQRAEPAGELRITAPADVGQWLLPPVLGALTTEFPAVRPIVHLSNRIVDLEREGFDVALRISMGSLPDSGLRVRRLGRIVTQLYGAPAYLEKRGCPTTRDEVDDHALVGLSGTSAGRFRRSSVVAADDMVLAAELVKHGVGLALLPSFLVQDAVDEGKLVVLMPGTCFGVGTLHAVFPGVRELSSRSLAFRDHVVRFLEAHPLPEPPEPAPPVE